jgi:hypothetical protein
MIHGACIPSVHIDPNNASQKEKFVDRSSKQLPPGIDAIRIWGDMLDKLYRSADEIARRDWAMNWLPTLREEKKVKYVVTVPVAWNRGERMTNTSATPKRDADP